MVKRFLGLSAALVAACTLGSLARAAVFPYSFVLNGASENPVNASPGTGTGSAIYDDVAGTLTLSAAFGGLQGNVTQTHFHAVTATDGRGGDAAAAAVVNVGIAIGNTTLPGFPLGVTSGNYNQVLDLNDPSIYGAGFLSGQGSVANARTAFVDALANGRTYWNVHTSSFPGGEIRGFPVLVPEPASTGLCLVGLIAFARRRRS